MNWIVVADSSTSTLKDAGQILCRQEMRVTGFKTGQALKDYLRDNRPDMILLGSVVWDLGGFDAISEIRRAAGPGSAIPVLLMLDREDRSLRARAQAMGAAGVIDKPLMSAALTASVREILESRQRSGGEAATPHRNDIEEIVAALEECSDSSNGLWMGRKVFGNVLRNMLRYQERYHGTAFQVLFTMEMGRTVPEAQRAEIMAKFRNQLQRILRSSDIMMESGENQLLLLLLVAQDAEIGQLISKVIDEWKQTEYGAYTNIASEVRRTKPEPDGAADLGNRAEWVVVVDDDVTNLKMAGMILSKQHMRVTALRSGRALLDFVKDNRPDLILLDIRMPEMDGFETMRRLRQQMPPGQEIPVIFLTSDEKAESEMKGLDLGAMDFIKKPFVPEVLILRVRHIIELVRLQKNLADEVELKTQENENLSLRVVQTLAEAIDAKDTYTNGHSGRVAWYAREIARRFGYIRRRQDEIYMMGLLHDVGKIGVPDSVINKPSRLTEKEYAQVKTHPVMGDRILKNIRERPKLALGARWHHEHYDGTGYPDGLSGEDIPEEARIIAVADAYDAMTSRRSYRGMLPQDAVRSEIERGKGTQFDPVFADIMLQIIAEDPEYKLREH